MTEKPANSLAVRMASALVLLPLAAAAIHFGGWFFAAMVLAGAALMVQEWNVLCGGKAFHLATIVGVASVVLAGILALVLPIEFAVATLAAGAVFAWIVAAQSGLKGVWAAAGVVYTGAPCLALLWLRNDDELGRWLTFLLFCAVWATDIGAYAAGRSIGGPRLAPKISPKKTWAGLAGGMLFAVVSGIVLAKFGNFAPLWAAGLLGAAATVLAQVGDLGESMVKRHFNAKDSGALIPGHGGILDRVDGLVLTAPALALLVAFAGRNWGANS